MRLFSTGVALGVLLAACSTASRPPTLGGCTATADASCSGPGGGGGGGSSGGSEGGAGTEAGTCTADPTTSQCEQCTDTDCCADLETCGGDTLCEMLLSCASHCPPQADAGASACVTSCEQQYRGESAIYRALLACVSVHCPVCAQEGIGDPCASTSSACVATGSCTGLWCTRLCTRDSDCAGLGPGGGNFTGQPGACRHVATGDYCFPGCSGDPDCTSFAGTYCVVSRDVAGAPVQVCATGPDAGLD